MPLWIYQLPAWQFGALLLAGWTLPALGSFELVQRFCKARFSEADQAVAMTLLALVATLNSLLLAFCAVSVWDAFRSADTAVNNEALTIAELARDLAVYGTPHSLEARERVREYARSIVDTEWAQMQHASTDADNGLRLNRIFRALNAIEPSTNRERAILAEIWARANETLKFRRERTSAAEAKVPASLWLVVIAGGILSLVPMLVLPATMFNRLAVAFLSLSTSLVFFFIAQMDHPFVGDQSVSPRPYQVTLHGMAVWDEGPR